MRNDSDWRASRSPQCKIPMATQAGVTIREFVMRDYDGAIALWKSVEGVEISEGDSRGEIMEYLKRNPGLSRVAEADGKIVAVALCGHDGRRGWIYHLAVASDYRREKIGQRLLEDCVRGLRQAGLKRAIILVAGDNPDGHQFWLRNGWEDISGAIAMTREL
jgi:ribosomal protein S18 acetylase RimI-like enzyme